MLLWELVNLMFWFRNKVSLSCRFFKEFSAFQFVDWVLNNFNINILILSLKLFHLWQNSAQKKSWFFFKSSQIFAYAVRRKSLNFTLLFLNLHFSRVKVHKITFFSISSLTQCYVFSGIPFSIHSHFHLHLWCGVLVYIYSWYSLIERQHRVKKKWIAWENT